MRSIRGVFGVDLVNVHVERAPVQRAVREEVEHVLEDEKECNLQELLLPWGEGHLPSSHAECLSLRVEEPDLRDVGGKEGEQELVRRVHWRKWEENTYDRELYYEVREEDLLGALPLLLRCRNLVGLQFPLPEVGYWVDEDP